MPQNMVRIMAKPLPESRKIPELQMRKSLMGNYELELLTRVMEFLVDSPQQARNFSVVFEHFVDDLEL